MSRASGHVLGRVTILKPTASKPLLPAHLHRPRRTQEVPERRPRRGDGPGEGRAPESRPGPRSGRERSGGSGDDGCAVRLHAGWPQRDKSGQLLDEDWTPNHWTKVRQGLNRAISGLSDDQRRMPISALDGRTIDLMRSACGTRGMVRETTRHVRGFLRWAYEARAITREQLEFLPMNAPVLDP